MSKNYFQIIKDGILVDGSGGGDAPAPVLITKSVTENGTYSASSDNADGYSTVSVDVPNRYTAQDEGKVVHNGALETQGTLEITQNGTYDTTNVRSITVNVSPPAEQHIYGVSWDKSSSPLFTRTDDAANFSDPDPYVNDGVHSGSSPFDTLMPWAGMTVETIDGNSLVKVPKFWYKITNTYNELKFQIADYAADGFKVSPAHQARNSNETDRDFVYIGRYKCSADNNSYCKSVSGVSPIVNITRGNARTNITNIGAGYYQQDFAMFWTIRMLYLVEFANWNSQEAIGYGCGNGSSSQNTGASDSMPYHTGTMQTSRTTYGLGCQYRYIEDLWGNVYEWVDGIRFSASTIYAYSNPSTYSDSSGGTNVGARVATSNEISDWIISSDSEYDWFLYPSTVVSDSSYNTYVCDRCFYGSSGVVLSASSSWYQSQERGLFYLSGGSDSSYSSSSIGARLQYLP